MLIQICRTFFLAAIKAQVALVPLFLYYRHLLKKLQVQSRFLWNLHKLILLALCLLILIFIIPGPAVPDSRTTGPVQIDISSGAGVDPAGEQVLTGPVLETGYDQPGKFIPTRLLYIPGHVIDLLMIFSLGGLLFFLLRLVNQILTERKYIAMAVKIHSLGRVKIIYSKNIQTAYTSGLLYPKIFLPSMLGRDRQLHKAVLAHERTHIRLGHHIWLLLENILARCFWYNPLALGLLQSGIRLREFQCDQIASSRFPGQSYLDLLLQSAAITPGNHQTAVLAARWKTKQQQGLLYQRVARLINGGRRASGKIIGVLTGILIFCTLAACLATSCFNLEPETKADLVNRQDQPADIPAEIIKETDSRQLLWPFREGVGRITAFFGLREHPFEHTPFFHNGIDIAWTRRTPVLAAAGGLVLETGNEPDARGIYIILSHKRGLTTLYAHLDRTNVAAADIISQGQVIGETGVTGLTTGPHLHFEVREKGKPVDPIPYLEQSMQNSSH